MKDEQIIVDVPLDEEFEDEIQYEAYCDGDQRRPYLAIL